MKRARPVEGGVGAERPWWVTVLALVTGAGVPFNALRDLLSPESRYVEVWAGFEVTGAWALATAPVHWALLAVAAFGFWRCRPWMWPWASLYVFYVAISHLVWSEASPHGQGWPMGLLQAAAIGSLGMLLWRARSVFRPEAADAT